MGKASQVRRKAAAPEPGCRVDKGRTLFLPGSAKPRPRRAAQLFVCSGRVIHPRQQTGPKCLPWRSHPLTVAPEVRGQETREYVCKQEAACVGRRKRARSRIQRSGREDYEHQAKELEIHP